MARRGKKASAHATEITFVCVCVCVCVCVGAVVYNVAYSKKMSRKGNTPHGKLSPVCKEGCDRFYSFNSHVHI